MVTTAYLRVYEPLALFPARERFLWSAQSTRPEGDDNLEILASRKWLITTALPGGETSRALDEGAFLRQVNGRLLVCPWRTRLRMLTSMLAFRGAVPDEVADAFVPEQEAHRAARELALIDGEDPKIRSHILHANWHVPLRWFGAFDDSERIIVEDKAGLRLRYETSMRDARRRLGHTLGVLEVSDMDEDVTEALRELLDWLGSFSDHGLVELDYGSVARIFDDDELLEDRSAAELSLCLRALEEGDTQRAERVFSTLTQRWTEVRSLEILN